MSSEETIAELWKWLREHERFEREHQAVVNDRLGNIEDTLAQAKGGWRVLLILGAVAAAIGSTVSGIIPTWMSGPK
jgi:hypothetical protein